LNGKNNSSKNYILITPCKNEAKNLPNLIKSISSQSITPIVWLIINDASTDGTYEILKMAAKYHDWIIDIQLNEKSERDRGMHLASITKMGFDTAITYCTEHGFDYEYLGNIDADLTVEPDFFENLITELENNPELGIASGGTDYTIGSKIVRAKISFDEPSGGDMLIRKKCFEDCEGVKVSYAYDSVLKAKAKLKGWKTMRFEDNIATEIRDVSSAEGYWKGYLHKGKVAYYLNYNPIHVIGKSVLFFSIKPHYTGLAFLLSYFINMVKRKERIDDDEVRDFFWNKLKYNRINRAARRNF